MGVFEKAIAQGEEILDYIPQRKPIVMVDKLWSVNNEVSYSGLTVLNDNMFCKDGYLQDVGIIEHIAQSAALRIGYMYKVKNKEVPLGFIGSINKMRIEMLPKVGDELMTEIVVMQEVFGITLLVAKVSIGELKIAECEMKVAVAQN
ncbi:MAG: hydroxymyristoyl-ACP dehydratase [Bacteroidales bacterium]